MTRIAWRSPARLLDRISQISPDPLWSSTPGGPPKDSSFSFPVVGTEHGRRVLYSSLGGGFVCCINALTGDPIWRFPLATGGLSSSVVKYKDSIIAMNGKENTDDSTIGRMVSIKCGSQPGRDGEQITLTNDDENWRKHSLAWIEGNTARLDYRPVHLDPLTKAEEGGIDLKKIAPKARVY